MFTVVVPVYRNEECIPDLLAALEEMDHRLAGDLEAVLVVDGSPDCSLEILARELPARRFRSQLLGLSRNFGSFAAIMAGLSAGHGDAFGVMAADLQEPIELVLEFRDRLASGRCDVVVGTRTGRCDPLLSRAASGLFWWSYRRLVQREVPPGGVDVFGCSAAFRDHLLALRERNATLVGLVFWLGFRREEVPYVRRPRLHGRSAWSLRRRVRYLLDSGFAFSDLPVRLMTLAGLVGLSLSTVLAIVVLVTRIRGGIPVPGYTATVLSVMFFGGLNSLGIGVLGEYVWRTFENSKGRPGYVVAARHEFSGRENR
ncbi:MAG: glycosyltransferase family 2 protein [Vicinamibacteria bacterium]